jgi:hypothetical protein
MSPKDNNKQVSAAVRILHQKRDASARATHLKAGSWIVQFSTIERKKMSTKTSFKRIALVAASALAIAGFSAVPANAAQSLIVTGTPALSGTATAGYTLSAVSGTYPQLVVSGSADSTINISTSGAGTIFYGATPALTTLSIAAGSTNALWYAGTTTPGAQTFTTAGATAAGSTLAISAYSAVAGSQVISLVGNDGGTTTLTITWGAAPAVTTASTSFISNVTNATPAADVASIQVPKTAAVLQAIILVTTNSATATNIAGTGLRAVISGPGTLGISSQANAINIAPAPVSTGRDISRSAALAAGHAFYYVAVYGDGTSGVSTITLTVGTTVVGTETLTFYGSLATLKATVKKNVTGDAAVTAGALDVIGYDSAGVVVPMETISITSGTTATIASFSEVTSTATEVAAGTAVVDVTGIAGKFGAVVLTIKDTATGLISTTATVNVGATEAATVTATTDAATYAAGDKVTLTLTALDKNGVPVGDGTTAGALAITTNGAVQGTMPTAATFAMGKQVITFYAPLVSANLTVNIKLAGGAAWSTALDDTTIVASASVEGDSTAALALDAANAATDAANNAYDEAQNATQAASDALAAVTELAVQVTSLIAMVKKLTAAVAKLSKKK